MRSFSVVGRPASAAASASRDSTRARRASSFFIAFKTPTAWRGPAAAVQARRPRVLRDVVRRRVEVGREKVVRQRVGASEARDERIVRAERSRERRIGLIERIAVRVDEGVSSVQNAWVGSVIERP